MADKLNQGWTVSNHVPEPNATTTWWICFQNFKTWHRTKISIHSHSRKALITAFTKYPNPSFNPFSALSIQTVNFHFSCKLGRWSGRRGGRGGRRKFSFFKWWKVHHFQTLLRTHFPVKHKGNRLWEFASQITRSAVVPTFFFLDSNRHL